MQSLISIALCTYNGEKFLAEQLDSIINQTYKNIEIIITDDCSTDKTHEILHSYASKYSFIHFEINKNNLGFKRNFEKAISLCTGEYIALSDQDDVWSENKLEKLFTQIGNHSLIYCGSIKVDESLKPISFSTVQKKFFDGSGSASVLLFENIVSGHAMMFRKNLVPHFLPLPDGHQFHDWWIAYIAFTTGSVTYTKENLVLFRRHTSSITNGEKTKYKNILHRFEIKSQQLIIRNTQRLNEYDAYLSLPLLDNTTKMIITQTKQHFENYNKI